MLTRSTYIEECINEVRNAIRSEKYPDAVTDDEFTEYLSTVDGQKHFGEKTNNEKSRFVEHLVPGLSCNNNIRKNREKQLHDEINLKYGDGFAWLSLYYELSREITDFYTQDVEKQLPESDKQNTFIALALLYGKALLWFNTIRCLLENGYPDGALSIWRNLHEIWAVSEFLYHDTEDVAKTFLESGEKISTHAAGHYRWAEGSTRINLPPNPDCPLHSKPCPRAPKKEILIHNIVKKAQETHFNMSKGKQDKLYSYPNHIIHPSASGVIHRVAHPFDGEMIVEGVATGFSKVAINSVAYMYFTTKRFISVIPNEASVVGAALLKAIIEEKIMPVFNSIEQGIGEESKTN